MRKTVTLVLVLLLLLICFTGCGKGSKLAGTWVPNDDDDVFVLKDDGTGSIAGISLTWYVEGKTLYLNHLFGTEVLTISGNKLVESDGTVYTKR